MRIDLTALIPNVGNQSNTATASLPIQSASSDATPAQSPAKALAEKYDVRNMSADDVWRMVDEGVSTGAFPASASGKWVLLGAPDEALSLNDPGVHSQEKTDIVEMTSQQIEYNKSVNNQQGVDLYSSLLSRLMMLDSLRGSDIPASV